MRFCLPMILCAAAAAPAWANHAYALWGEPRYGADFKHFGYVNPNAPKGGELRLVSGLRYSTFDKYNPFTIKGSPPAYLSDMLFESLLTGSLDETATGYGLLAEDVVVAPDGLSVTFRLRKEARFHNGKPVTAQDVKYSYETLISKYVSPGYKTLLVEVDGCDVVDDRTVRFRFKKPNRDLPLTVGGLPVFSRDWGKGDDGKARPFDQVVTDIPIGSGPYKIGPVNFGKDITYVRDPGYWGKDLPVRVGSNNFDKVTVKIYRDSTARLEALKAGEFDLMRFFSAGDWARRLYGKRFDSGELRKGDFANKLPSGFQSYFLNTRRPLLQDARVRQALGLAYDFEWMSRQMFYGSYQRVHGLFGNTACETHGAPSAAELALLQPFEKDLPAGTLDPIQEPPRTDGAPGEEGGEHTLRGNLRKAQKLLADAGWRVGSDGLLRNAKGEPLVLEYLDSSEGGAKVVSAWTRNLEKLGITLKLRVVDFALYQQRMDKFDFDIITLNIPGTNNPGQEYAELFGSAAADQEGSGNFIGLKNPAVDAMIAQMSSAKTEEQLLPACHALERIIVAGHYLIPQYYAGSHRMVYDAWRLVVPPQIPAYAPGETWVINNWWARLPPLTAETAKP
ncbi:microcin C transport system substrate-binding protein [Comamonas odontotermitis]|uniref:Microcin C transport system substrate-binding protein n=1 Tax=Comamonas odontotermitis TaxID=379895 RepID=A0ABR6RIB5_9BURK|nr:extracellular solute-binding protein [Comamonas odontotermitis]MBB6578899.1 microcin C transport system substrate-binding protein [Comamonas odontotermitis]